MKIVKLLFNNLPLVIVLSLLVLTGCSNNKTPSSRIYIEPENRKAIQVVNKAKKMLGVSYKYGGASPSSGFDCSGLVWFTHAGLIDQSIRTSKQQFKKAKKVPVNAIRPGDLLFYKTSKTPTHVTIYIGNGQFIHAPSSGKKVMISRMDNPYFKSRLVKAGRLY